jgi:hypothetical protein
MSGTPAPGRARALSLAGLLLALVVTGSLPAWAGATSSRPSAPSTICAVDAAGPSDTLEQVRC